MYLVLSNGRSNPARLKNVKFPVFIVSPLEIRRPMVDDRDAAREKGRAKPYGVRPSVA